MSDIDPISPHRLLRYRGKTCVFTGRKPLQLGWGRKNPNLPYPSIAVALQAYNYILSSLNV